ncbi:hypothetical protein K440DRAFT_616020 [Wilcoxina mikolae CBS 423.85]|nr:hypothetical protein K440DRAFT_616020 [Wilcoxina mikolae CBS 423.85]
MGEVNNHKTTHENTMHISKKPQPTHAQSNKRKYPPDMKRKKRRKANEPDQTPTLDVNVKTRELTLTKSQTMIYTRRYRKQSATT